MATGLLIAFLFLLQPAERLTEDHAKNATPLRTDARRLRRLCSSDRWTAASYSEHLDRAALPDEVSPDYGPTLLVNIFTYCGGTPSV
jgi:hypothetical protein